MAKPPAGSSLLFGALADSGQIKQRKNGIYRMVLKGVDEIDWFTDRPDRVEGTWKPQKLLRRWDKYFANSEPNAQATVEVGEQRELFTFEMFKPKIQSGKMMFNVKPLSDSGRDKLTSIQDIELSDISLFIDDAIANASTGLVFPSSASADHSTCNMIDARLTEARLNGANLTGAELTRADLTDAVLSGANLTRAELTDADLSGANLTDAILTDADLSEANLSDANLPVANLTNANLTDANLSFANLNGANLHGADLKNATLIGTIWNETICPDGTKNSGTLPCTEEQLSLA